MNRTQKLLVGLLLIGLLASAAAVTYATFTAQVTNSNQVQAGTLYLGNAGNATASTCFSYGSIGSGSFTNGNSNTCQLSVGLPTNTAPGAATSIFVVQLENKGNLPATLTLTGTCADSAATGATFHGAGSLCAALGMDVQPCASYTGGTTCTSKQAACTYPVSATTQCASPPGGTVSGFAAGTYSGILSNWAANALQAYEIDIQLPGTADNTIQGMTATFALTWSTVPS